MERAGAAAWGVARAEEVDPVAEGRYRRWLASGRAADMEYLARYPDVRRDPRLLLEGARSLVIGAFPYLPPRLQPAGAPRFARYAYGRDYHTVLRARMEEVAAAIRECDGGDTRVCVDTAPLRERYWAERAGVGFIGRNNQLIVPGAGSWVLLATVITTADIPPSSPSAGSCPEGCDLCLRACPGKALPGDSTVDARRCLSYLTIEHRGELPPETRLGNRVYGCDECQIVCPFNRSVPATTIAEFHPSEEFLALTREKLSAMTQEDFSALFRQSAVKRTKLAGLLRNVARLST